MPKYHEIMVPRGLNTSLEHSLPHIVISDNSQINGHVYQAVTNRKTWTITAQSTEDPDKEVYINLRTAVFFVGNGKYLLLADPDLSSTEVLLRFNKLLQGLDQYG